MTDAEDEIDDLEGLINHLLEEMRDLNIRVGTLRLLLLERLGVTQAEYDEAHARATLAGHVPPDGGENIKH